MIRTATKIYGEPNDPNTVIASTDLGVTNLIVGAGNKGIKAITPGPNQLFITDGTGNITTLALGVANKAIGTNEVGDIVIIDREEE
jgi:hypothetical protein